MEDTELAGPDTFWDDDYQPDECFDCEGAGCSTCDGTPLTEDEIAEQLGE